MNNNLARLLDKYGVTRKLLRKHFKRATICRHLNGSRTPDIRSSSKYARLLGISLEQFLKEINNE